MASATSRASALKGACALVCAAGVAAALLSLRQQRLLAARDMLRLHEQALDRRMAAQRLRAEIALLIAPESLEPRARRALPLAAIEPAPRDALAPDPAAPTLVVAGAPASERRR